jgi:phosphatidylserine/phosphatidylglycerophosphate/cardiolipin synthase-like enzyme
LTATCDRILVEGKTCWQVACAARVAVLIDGADYFRALRAALQRARARIVIVGWDLDPGIRLEPDDPDSELRGLLRALVDSRPELEVHLLVWDVAVVFGPSRTSEQLIATSWQNHPRIQFRFDREHPFGASHHEKIVTIDDALAFAGGIDLTVERWDTSRHTFDSGTRRDPDGEPYDPVHDLQMAVDGEAARALALLTRERWQRATGETLAPVTIAADPWPADLAPWLAGAEVGIARTRPARGEQPAIGEVAALNAAALSAARHSVYIETQYLAAAPIADRLVELLERPDGPEIVLLVWRRAIGWIERFAMGSNRDRMLRRLAAADRHGRLLAGWLGEPQEPQREINLHAKLIIVDDRFVRIGSSNLNHRSQGLDGECDLAIEARDERTRRAIAGLRERLLAEHLVRSPAEVGRAVAEHGLIGAIERLNPGAGRVRRHRIDPGSGAHEPLTGTALLDPSEPLDLDHLGRLLKRAVTG